MTSRLGILLSLFKKTFVLQTLLLLIVFLITLSVDTFRYAYEKSLENDFVSKTAHIQLEYISHKAKIDEALVEKILKLSNKIEALVPYFEEKLWLNLKGKGFFSSLQYQGELTLIGMDTGQFGLYPMAEVQFLRMGPYQIPYTLLEAEYLMLKEKETAFFNRALFNAFYPPLVSSSSFETGNGNLSLLGVFDDYLDKSIIYTTIAQANKLSKHNEDYISGYYLYLKDMSSSKEILKVLQKEGLDKEMKLSHWLENDEKRNEFFELSYLFSWFIIVFVVLISVLLNVLLLYREFISKSQSINILHRLGYLLYKDIMIFILFIVIMTSFLAIAFLGMNLAFLSELFHLELDLYVRRILIIVLSISSIYILSVHFFLKAVSSIRFSR